MKAIVLAAGYATRLYPLTKDRPKPLLEVAGKTILDYITEKMDRVKEIDEIIIVTNDKFAGHFEEWANEADYSKKLTVVNDGTLTNETRLGAIGDIQYVIEQLGIQDDLMVLAGDNLFEFELTDYVSFYDQMKTSCIATYAEDNIEQLKRNGIAEIDENQKVIGFEEKPAEPKSKYCVPTLYILQESTLPLINQYLEEGNNPDAPGQLIPYFVQHSKVHAYLFEGKRYDIGTVESYEKVQQIFADKTK